MATPTTFVDPEELTPLPRRGQKCVICETLTPEARAFILKQPMVERHEWKRLKAWFVHPKGGNLPPQYATMKRMERHFEQCEGLVKEDDVS